MTRSLALLLVLSAVPAAAEGPVQVLECRLDVAATQGASGQIALEGGVMTLVDVAIYGETGRVEVTMTRLGDGLSRVVIRSIAYQKPAAQGTGTQTITGQATLLMHDNAVCETEGCARYQGAIDAKLASQIFGTVLAGLASPRDCVPVWPPKD
jgi:hypothetical protein